MTDAHPWFINLSVVPYTSDIGRFLTIPARLPLVNKREWRLVYVGQLIERKGLIKFIEHIVKFMETRSDIELIITLIGEGYLKKELKEKPMPSNTHLKVIGQIAHDELYKYLIDQDVFFLPSLADTWATVINEAMAAGLPILGSIRSQAVEELVQEGVNGWIYDPLDSASVSLALNRCFENRSSYNEMGRMARICATAITPQNIADRIEFIIDECSSSATNL